MRTPFALAFILALLASFWGAERACAWQQSSLVKVNLRATSVCSANVLRFGDVATFTGNAEQVRELELLPLAPSPTKGAQQSWNQRDIERILALRGVQLDSLQWHGSAQCFVERSEKFVSNSIQVRIAPAPATETTTEATATKIASPATRTASFPDLSTNHSLTPPRGQSESDSNLQSAVKPASYANAFVSPGVISQAEYIVASLIENYLQTETESEAAFLVEPAIAPEQARLLVQRRQIVSISGGLSPYEGEQEFQVKVQDGETERSFSIKAMVSLPELYLAAKTQLPKGHLLRAEDLSYTVLPRGSKESGESYVLRMDELVGKELKRSMSARQMIRRTEVSTPKLIHVGDLIKIEVVLGGVVIETNGKALESGGADELIHVETIDYRKRLVARVRSERVVEVYSQGNGAAMNASARRNNPKRSVR